MGGGRGPRPRQTRGQDALVPLDIDLSTAVFGGNADLVIDTTGRTIESAVGDVLNLLQQSGHLSKEEVLEWAI